MPSPVGEGWLPVAARSTALCSAVGKRRAGLAVAMGTGLAAGFAVCLCCCLSGGYSFMAESTVGLGIRCCAVDLIRCSSVAPGRWSGPWPIGSRGSARPMSPLLLL